MGPERHLSLQVLFPHLGGLSYRVYYEGGVRWVMAEKDGGVV